MRSNRYWWTCNGRADGSKPPAVLLSQLRRSNGDPCRSVEAVLFAAISVPPSPTPVSKRQPSQKRQFTSFSDLAML